MRIALLGGGLDMLSLPLALGKWCQNVHCYLAPRHSQEEFDGVPLGDLLSNSGIRNFVVKSESELKLKIKNQNYDLVLGIGPAWIISEATLLLAKTWVNINAIPIPKYMGGAHSSWQLLNGDFAGAITFQEFSHPVDKGRILAMFRFTYLPEHSTPEFRIKENSRQLLLILGEAMTAIISSSVGMKEELNLGESEYWPRLNTEIHGWIDWQWSGLEIVSFIQAFGRPYPGAHSELLGETVYFEGAATLEPRKLHPFSAGIIIKSHSNGGVDIATKDGILRVRIKLAKNMASNYLEGLRFHSPIEKLESARITNLRSKDM
jgi:methionyl-tRNA formyltransferase